MRANPYKFILLLTTIIGLVVLLVVEVVSWAEVSGLMGLIVGYATANGIGAAKGQDPAPLFETRKEHDHEAP